MREGSDLAGTEAYDTALLESNFNHGFVVIKQPTRNTDTLVRPLNSKRGSIGTALGRICLSNANSNELNDTLRANHNREGSLMQA